MPYNTGACWEQVIRKMLCRQNPYQEHVSRQIGWETETGLTRAHAMSSMLNHKVRDFTVKELYSESEKKVS